MVLQFLRPAVFLFIFAISSSIRFCDSVVSLDITFLPSIVSVLVRGLSITICSFLSFASNCSASLCISTPRASASSCFCWFSVCSLFYVFSIFFWIPQDLSGCLSVAKKTSKLRNSSEKKITKKR